MKGAWWQHLIAVAPVVIVTLVLLLPRLGEIFRRREDERLDPELIEQAREKRRAMGRR
jgi:hypothetical protein